MKQRITAAELKAMTMKELSAWVEFNACAINRTMVMSWGHEELFKEYHIRPEYIGWKAGRLIVKAFHFTSRTRKADAQSFAEWLHWAIFGEYPAEETTETAEQVEETEAETIEETAEEAKEVATMKKYFKVTFEYAEDIYCTNLAHAEAAEDVEREYSKYPWKSIKEAQPWDVDEAKMKGMPIIEVEAAQHPQEAPQEAPATEAEQQPTETENAPQKAAADNATIATAASRYNDLLKAFSAAKYRIITALANVDPLTLCPAAVTELENIGKAIGEYAWKGLSGAARDINQFEAAARDNKFTTPANYDAAYNKILEKLAAILPEDASAAKEAV